VAGEAVEADSRGGDADVSEFEAFAWWVCAEGASGGVVEHEVVEADVEGFGDAGEGVE
jgi:hypothetical protein